MNVQSIYGRSGDCVAPRFYPLHCGMFQRAKSLCRQGHVAGAVASAFAARLQSRPDTPRLAVEADCATHAKVTYPHVLSEFIGHARAIQYRKHDAALLLAGRNQQNVMRDFGKGKDRILALLVEDNRLPRPDWNYRRLATSHMSHCCAAHSNSS